jgi:hypothetical protein
MEADAVDPQELGAMLSEIARSRETEGCPA